MGVIVYQDIDLTVPATADVDIWSLFAAASKRVRLLGWELTSSDIAAEVVELELRRITVVGSVGASSTTEEAADELAGAITANVRTLDTTAGTGGGNLMSYNWEQLGPVGHTWIPEAAPRSLVSEGFAVTNRSAVGFAARGWICWEEI